MKGNFFHVLTGGGEIRLHLNRLLPAKPSVSIAMEFLRIGETPFNCRTAHLVEAFARLCSFIVSCLIFVLLPNMTGDHTLLLFGRKTILTKRTYRTITRIGFILPISISVCCRVGENAAHWARHDI